MEFNVLNDDRHIAKVSSNVFQFAITDEYFHYFILRYKIREFDVRGALDGNQLDTAYWASKSCLKTAISIFLYCKGVQQYTKEDGFFLLERLKLALRDEPDKYDFIRNILYANEQEPDAIVKVVGLIKVIIHDWLIPNEIWDLWGIDRQFNFKCYLDSVLTLKRAFIDIDKTLMERPTYDINYIEEMNNRSQRITKEKE